MINSLFNKIKSNFDIKKTLIFVSLIFLSIFISIIISKFVPYNMDEFIHYHPIACLHFEHGSENIFSSNCETNNLKIFNITLPLRSYDYVGSFRALLYYPLFIIWQSPESARFFGLLLLLIEGIILSKIFKIKYYYFFIGFLLFFPYFFMHAVDTGPVAFHLISIYLIYYLFLRWKDNEKWYYPFLIGTIVLLAVWEKPIFLIYGLPLFLLFIYLKPSIKMWKQLIFPIFIFSTAIGILFFASTYDGKHYYDEIFKRSDSITSTDSFIKSPVISAVFNPYYATHRIYNVKNANAFSIFYGLFVLLSPFLVGRKRKEYLFFYFLFIIQVLLIASLKQAFAMHHTILAYPFLILSFMYSLDFSNKNMIKKWLLVFILLNIIIFFTFTAQKVDLTNDKSRIEINTILNNTKIADEYYYIILDWGDYYYQSLYGPRNQSVIYIDSSKDINLLEDLATLKDKKSIFIYRKYSPYIETINKVYPLEVCYYGQWQIATKQEEGGCVALKKP